MFINHVHELYLSSTQGYDYFDAIQKHMVPTEEGD